MKTFPKFVDRMERMLSNWDGTTRKTVDRAYAKIIKSMFETLEQCAQQVGADIKNAVDEKDSLNTHILTVENMHHFYTEIRARKVPGLEESVKQAKFLYDMNLELYCKVVIRKPLGKLLVILKMTLGIFRRC
jgi:exocyst complex component 1